MREVSSSVLMLRQEAKIKLRWPISSVYVEGPERVQKALTNLKEYLLLMCNAKNYAPISGKPLSLETEQGTVYIDTTITEELYEEAVVNEIKRRIQLLRKKAGLKEGDAVDVYLEGETELVAIAKKYQDAIASAVHARNMLFEPAPESEEFIIDGRRIKIKVGL